MQYAESGANLAHSEKVPDVNSCGYSVGISQHGAIYASHDVRNCLPMMQGARCWHATPWPAPLASKCWWVLFSGTSLGFGSARGVLIVHSQAIRAWMRSGATPLPEVVCLAALMPSSALWSVRRAVLIICTGNYFCNACINSPLFGTLWSSAGNPC